MRGFQCLYTAFILGAENVSVLQFFQEIILDKVALFTSGTIKEEDSTLVVDNICHVGLLTGYDYHRVLLMETAIIPREPTFALITCNINQKDYFSIVRDTIQSLVQLRLPRAKGMGFHLYNKVVSTKRKMIDRGC